MLTVARLFQLISLIARFYSPFVVYAVTPRRAKSRNAPSAPRALRQLLETLGGAFIKYGQILAMRPDVVPAAYIQELSQLLDSVPPFPGEEARRIVERELGRPLNELFAAFDLAPLAAASFAQVHRATLLTGEAVVVKILRPGLRSVAKSDIGIIMLVAHAVDFLGIMGRVKITPLAEEFKDWTEDELDLRVEATYAQRLREVSREDPNSCIPAVFWEFTAQQVMTMEFMDGVWVSEVLSLISMIGLDEAKKVLAKRDIDLDRVASNIVDNQLRQAFEHRLFHADPHAGNLVILSNNVIGYVDFGITGELDSEFRTTQLMLYDALHRRDDRQYTRAMYRAMKPPPDNVDLEAFEREIKRSAARWRNSLSNPKTPLQERASSWLGLRNLRTVRKYGLEMSQTTLRYYRALSVVELIVLRMTPEFNFVSAIAVYLKQLQLREFAREVKMDAKIQQMFANRRLMNDGLAELRRILSSDERYNDIPRRHIVRWKLAVAFVLKTLAIVAVIAAVAIPVVSTLLQLTSATLLRFGTWQSAFMLLAMSVVLAWLGQRIYVNSLR